MNWLNNLFHNFPVLCLGLATFPSSDGKPLGSSEPLETPTAAMRSEPVIWATGLEDSFFDPSITMEKLEEIAIKVAETAKTQT